MLIYYTFFSVSIERQIDRIYKYFHLNNIDVFYIDLKPENDSRTERTYKVVTEVGDYVVEIKRLRIIRCVYQK